MRIASRSSTAPTTPAGPRYSRQYAAPHTSCQVTTSGTRLIDATDPEREQREVRHLVGFDRVEAVAEQPEAPEREEHGLEDRPALADVERDEARHRGVADARSLRGGVSRPTSAS